MNLQTLQGLYQSDTRLKELAAALSLPQPNQYTLEQLKANAISFVAHAVWHQSDVNHVFVLDDKDEAAYFHNDFEHLSGALDIFFFPDSYKKTGVYTAVNSSHIMLRTEALNKWSGETVHKKVLVTYPEALFEKVVQAKTLSKNVIQIAVNHMLDTKSLLERLTGLGFKHEDFVYEPGQFAIRGGILDIYSFGNEHPYRIELFGNEVDSIRLFNPETQLSERKLLQVSILPNIETNFETKEKVSLLDFIPQNTVFWFKDQQLLEDKLAYFQSKLEEQLAQSGGVTTYSDEEEETKEITPEDFEDIRYWIGKIKSFHHIHFNKPKAGAMVIPFNTEPQPSFNRNFDLLISNLKRWAEQKYTPYIFAENAKQLERLRVIFEDTNANVSFVPVPVSISNGFIDHDKKILVYTDHQIFQRFHKYKIKQAYSKGKAITMKSLRELQPGDFVSHIDYGVGVYSGLQKIDVNGAAQEAVRILYKDNDVLYVSINALHKISKYSGKEGTKPKVNKLGSDAWERLKSKTKKQVKDIAADLIRLYAKRKSSEGFAYSPDSYLQTELEASFFYEDTPDQSKAVADVKRDMEALNPMDRLVCGDVGFGKTEVAVRAAFKAVGDSKQVAVLVPTTILAYQHFQTFSERLKEFPCNVDYINRFKSAKEKKETLQKLESGKIDILIGTHALLSKDVKFKDLGLFIIDEEQKFGVAAKEKLRERKLNVDTLTLTATPIPRTLQFSLMSARDLSIINTPPPNRQPVHTELIGFDEAFIRDAIYYETERGGQVYFIHNRVQSLPSMAEKLKALCPDLEIAVAHGQMEGSKLEKTLLDFINYKYDVICCSNIVESGVDISNANTIIINNAHHFGLSDLHQLRGRVGRSNKKAFCYLVAPSLLTLPNDSRRRLQILEQFNELGSGFQIAMRDLDIRGAGNLLGGEQSGFIADIGFEMYQKILAEAIQELKSTDFKDVFAAELDRKKEFVTDCTIDTDLEILIPETYVASITERLSLYTQLDDLDATEDLKAFEDMLIDRFGPMPAQVSELFTVVRCRKMAKELGFEKLIIKNKVMRLYFINNPDSPYYESETFHKIMDYIQRGTNQAKMKQIGTVFLLVVQNIHTMADVQFFLEGAV
ncbi:transcription-repair coupling factor [Taibaiella sp. KBW10]|uniref:transcription-repair coupling factor n=1 Tax=Taibaiella sp. KBW10 TaxID=2153357 RepID=UPI000F59E520|nr:transcription-repair coupling factor [Taibaiella sp. KBW10]RQO31641.1 transcription-repair coupling factor [Taibaiella sp. KBW10]